MARNRRPYPKLQAGLVKKDREPKQKGAEKWKDGPTQSDQVG